LIRAIARRCLLPNALAAHALSALLALFALAVPRPSLAAVPGDSLSDGTRVARWTLANGLTVMTRHVPAATAVSVAIAFRVGADQDPPGRDGMGALLIELLLTAPAGQDPDRTREQLTGIRPMGWSVQLCPRMSLWTESASKAQFPGMLAQMATRLRGVTVTDAVLRTTVATVRRDQGLKYFGDTDVSLFHQVRELALGHDDAAILRRAAVKGLQQVSPREAQERLRTLYVPANAVMSLAGDLSGVDVHTLIEKLFGDIPRGTALAADRPPTLSPGRRVSRRLNLKAPIGAVAVIAPALDDPGHPSFYLSTLLMGDQCLQSWGVAKAPITTRFLYAVFADPALAYFYPPAEARETNPASLGRSLASALESLRAAIVREDNFDSFRTATLWLLGGPMTPKLVDESTTGRKAIVLITDGVDNASRITAQEAMQTARKIEVPIYTVGFTTLPWEDEKKAQDLGINMAVLRLFAEEAGGEVFVVRGPDEMKEAVVKISTEMRHQYLIGYNPGLERWDGRFRYIELVARNGRYAVRTRKGYYANP
jgi:hypothetical protein